MPPKAPYRQRGRSSRRHRRGTVAKNSKAKGITQGLTNYGDNAFSAYMRRSFARSMGYSTEMLQKPVVGITWTASNFNNCHRNVPEQIEAVKRGVLAAGGLPMDFPTVSLGEVFLTPTSLMFRNLMSMDVEEMIRAQPMDAVVLVGGCDKTVPALLMGGLSAGRPAIQQIVGPMMTNRFRGERLGACTDAMIEEGLTPDKIVTPKSIENGLRVLLAIGGSTNAIVHLTAIAGRMGIEISLDRLNKISDETPVLIDLKPTGEHYMEDLFFGGGVGAVLPELKPLLHLDCLTVAGDPLGQPLPRQDGTWYDHDVIRP